VLEGVDQRVADYRTTYGHYTISSITKLVRFCETHLPPCPSRGAYDVGATNQYATAYGGISRTQSILGSQAGKEAQAGRKAYEDYILAVGTAEQKLAVLQNRQAQVTKAGAEWYALETQIAGIAGRGAEAQRREAERLERAIYAGLPDEKKIADLQRRIPTLTGADKVEAQNELASLQERIAKEQQRGADALKAGQFDLLSNEEKLQQLRTDLRAATTETTRLTLQKQILDTEQQISQERQNQQRAASMLC